MNKKRYFEPVIDVLDIETSALLAGSTPGLDEGGSDTKVGDIDEPEAPGF